MIALLACAAAPPDSAPPSPVQCPPPSPTGRAVGDPADDVVLADCAGAPASLHGLCGRPALVVAWYGWCPSCDANAALARSLAEEHETLAVAVALVEDPLSQPVDAPFCGLYADAYPSPAAVWMDPEHRIEAYGGTDLVLVLDRDGTLRFVRQTSSEALIREAVDAVVR